MCFWIFHLLTWLLAYQFCSCTFTRTPSNSTDECIGGAAVLTWEYDTTSLNKVVWRKNGQVSLIVDKTGNVLFTKNEIEYVSNGTVKINTSACLESFNWCSICVMYTLESRKRTIQDTVYVTINESLQEKSNSPEDKEKCSCQLIENPNVEQQDVNSKSRNKTTYQNHTMKRCNIGRAIMCITESNTPGTNTSCEREHEVTTSTHVERYTTILLATFMVMVVLLIYVVIYLVKRKRDAKKALKQESVDLLQKGQDEELAERGKKRKKANEEELAKKADDEVKKATANNEMKIEVSPNAFVEDLSTGGADTLDVSNIPLPTTTSGSTTTSTPQGQISASEAVAAAEVIAEQMAKEVLSAPEGIPIPPPFDTLQPPGDGFQAMPPLPRQSAVVSPPSSMQSFHNIITPMSVQNPPTSAQIFAPPTHPVQTPTLPENVPSTRSQVSSPSIPNAPLSSSGMQLSSPFAGLDMSHISTSIPQFLGDPVSSLPFSNVPPAAPYTSANQAIQQSTPVTPRLDRFPTRQSGSRGILIREPPGGGGIRTDSDSGVITPEEVSNITSSDAATVHSSTSESPQEINTDPILANLAPVTDGDAQITGPTKTLSNKKLTGMQLRKDIWTPYWEKMLKPKKFMEGRNKK